MKFLKNIKLSRKVKFSIVTIIYILWFVVWTQNLWWLLGVPVIYDYYFSRYIDKIYLNRYRAFKSKNKSAKFILEWVEALLYAVVVIMPLKLYFFGLYVIPSGSMEVTLLTGDYIFVDRLAYGPKMPNTPLSFPFVQHTLPFTDDTPSFVEWWESDYKRLAGYDNVAKQDVVVFNFPAGDTVALKWPNSTYYDLIRENGKEVIHSQSKVVYRPVDKRENYIKRCVAVAGDTLRFVGQELFVNGVKQSEESTVQYDYIVPQNGGYNASIKPLTAGQVTAMQRSGITVRRHEMNYSPDAFFPHRPDLYPWTKDNYGPLWIPKAGETVALNLTTLPLYERVIKNYEGNSLEVVGEDIIINGEKATEYTFKMNYYFMMGDNRDNSADSRFWGFVPEDHVEGRAAFIWMSIEPGKNIFNGIRWDRMFNGIN